MAFKQDFKSYLEGTSQLVAASFTGFLKYILFLGYLDSKRMNISKIFVRHFFKELNKKNCQFQICV